MIGNSNLFQIYRFSERGHVAKTRLAFRAAEGEEEDVEVGAAFGGAGVAEDAPHETDAAEAVGFAVVGDEGEAVDADIAVEAFVVPEPPEDAVADVFVGLVRGAVLFAFVVEAPENVAFGEFGSFFASEFFSVETPEGEESVVGFGQPGVALAFDLGRGAGSVFGDFPAAAEQDEQGEQVFLGPDLMEVGDVMRLLGSRGLAGAVMEEGKPTGFGTEGGSAVVSPHKEGGVVVSGFGILSPIEKREDPSAVGGVAMGADQGSEPVGGVVVLPEKRGVKLMAGSMVKEGKQMTVFEFAVG